MDKKILGIRVRVISAVLITIFSIIGIYNIWYGSDVSEISAYSFCYSEMNTVDYTRCYTKDAYGNYEIDNISNNTQIVYDTSNDIRYTLSDHSKMKQDVINDEDLENVDANISNIFKSTGLDETTLENAREGRQIESADFTANEQYIIMNYFPEVEEIDVTSISYVLKDNVLTMTEYNKDNTSNFVTMSVLKNSDVPTIVIPE